MGLLLVLASCGPRPPNVSPPRAPASNDARFVVSGVRAFYLVGDALTRAQDALRIEVSTPRGTDVVDAWVAGRPGVRLSRMGDRRFRGALSLRDLAPGAHHVLFAADGSDTAFARLTLRRTHALYVLMTTDWDYADPSTQALARQDRMHERHRELRITHFVGPYTFTDPALGDARRAELAAWLRAKRDQHRDEIGLHIHPYCHFVQHAGLPCITDQSLVHPLDASGYTVKCAAYGEAGFAMLLDAAAVLFAQHGLGRPTSFRAGGWSASIETLRALASHGFLADSSALNWARLEEWMGRGTGELYRWNAESWRPISDTSQPYRPNQDDVLSASSPTLSILEVPDNGIMVDYVSVEEMVQIFRANWNGNELTAPRTLVLGFHPSEHFVDDRDARVEGILAHADLFLASSGAGPVVYATLSQMTRVFAGR